MFSHAIPILIPEKIKRQVKFIMKDGDQQHCNKIIQSLKHILCMTKDTCGWHVGKIFFCFGCENYLVLSFATHCCLFAQLFQLKSKRQQQRWKENVRTMHKWMYRWMRPKLIKDSDEYFISKYMFLQLISSTAMLNASN